MFARSADYALGLGLVVEVVSEKDKGNMNDTNSRAMRMFMKVSIQG